MKQPFVDGLALLLSSVARRQSTAIGFLPLVHHHRRIVVAFPVCRPLRAPPTYPSRRHRHCRASIAAFTPDDLPYACTALRCRPRGSARHGIRVNKPLTIRRVMRSWDHWMRWPKNFLWMKAWLILLLTYVAGLDAIFLSVCFCCGGCWYSFDENNVEEITAVISLSGAYTFNYRRRTQSYCKWILRCESVLIT